MPLVLAGCGPDETGPDVFIVAQWNVQTLFDGHETGREFSQFREAAGWTEEKYRARIVSLSRAILQMAPEESFGSNGLRRRARPMPDIIGFMEIENLGILEDFARGELSRHGYLWAAFASIPGAPIGVGFLSRLPIVDVRAHSITVEGVTAPRPLLEVRVKPAGRPVVLLLSHWKSKRGGDVATTPQRRASARVAQRRIGELKAAEPETPVIVMGDLNENHDEFYRHLGQLLTALLPDDPGAALLAAQRRPGSPPDFLVLSAEKPPRAIFFPGNVHALYSPWKTEKTGGTFYFRDRWQTIDHFLLCERFFDGTGWNYAGSSVLNHAPFVGADGTPNSYNPRTGRGLSDHLPLLLYLRNLGEN